MPIKQEKHLNNLPLSNDKDSPLFIPWLDNRAAPLDGYMISWNTLDSLAKYAGEHNRTLQISQTPIKSKTKTRPISKEEIVGLPSQETKFGMFPALYTKNLNAYKDWNIMRLNGGLPSYLIANNYHWLNNTDKSTHPLLDTYQYYAQGDYNRGDINHTKSVQNTGQRLFNKPQIQTWWEMSGKFEYDDKEKPLFVRRLEEPAVESIPDWEQEGKIATHKLSYANMDDKEVVFPLVQREQKKLFGFIPIGYHLIDYTDPKNGKTVKDALDNALKNNNVLVVPKGKGQMITTTYKDIYPGIKNTK